MGCGRSVPEADTGKSKKTSQVSTNQVDRDTVSSPIHQFELITANAQTIAATSNMRPVVCLNQDSFPIITSFLHLDDSTPTDLQLPIVAASNYGKGRVMCFSQISFLGPKAIQTGDTSKLLINSFNWLSGGSASMTPIFVLGFDSKSAQEVIKSLQDLGFIAERGKTANYISNYRSVMIPSNMELTDELTNNLINYVNDGGGLSIFYKYVESDAGTLPVNLVLSKFGLAFTYCMLNEEYDDAGLITIPPSFSVVRDSNLVSISENFKSVIGQQKINMSNLDDLVTTLRYYIIVCDDTHQDQLIEIAEYAWNFLKATNYITDDGICPEINQEIVFVLLQDLYERIPVEKLPPIPESEKFPGKTGPNVEMIDTEMTLQLTDEAWISTGLWLPVGKKGTVKAQHAMQDIHAQVGSHIDSLLSLLGPWKRCPNLVTSKQFETAEITIDTPFGGILYITVNSIEPIEPRDETFKFENFCKYPRAICGDDKVWEETKDIEVPWGELDVGSVIFTLPIEYLKKIADFNSVKEKFDTISSTIFEFINSKQAKPFRIIFDVQLVEDSPSRGYPLFFLIENIEDIIFKNDQPNQELFKLASLFALYLIRDNVLDSQTENAISFVAASIVFQKLYPGFDPMQFTDIQMPPVFAELWEIHNKYDNTLLSRTIEKLQNADYSVSEVPEEMWISFVREFCITGKCNFTKLLEKSRPIPLNIMTYLKGLPLYQPHV